MEITTEDYNYRVIKPIGVLDSYHSEKSVFEALMVRAVSRLSVSQLRSVSRRSRRKLSLVNGGEKVALKVVSVDDENYEVTQSQVRRSWLFRHAGGRILRHKNSFTGYYENAEYYCVAIPYEPQIQSLRFILRSNFVTGFPLNVISFALKGILLGLKDLHDNGEVHLEMSAGTVFYDNADRRIKLGFGASVYQPIAIAIAEELNSCPLFELPKWGRAPECEEGEFSESPSVDVWLLGFVALELGYGDIQVFDRDQLLQVISNIKKIGLTNAWNDLLNPPPDPVVNDRFSC